MIYAENILLCIAVPLLIALLFLRGSARRFVAAFLVGMTVCLISAYIGGFLGSVAEMSENDASIFLSPVIEELMKILPLLLFLLLFSPSDRSFAATAIAVGAGFATFENCCYILTSGAESLPYILIRGLAVGVMHIVSVLALSIWLILSKRLKAFSFPAVVGGLALSMIFHALYNLLVSEQGVYSVIGYAMPLVCAGLLYLLYRKLPFRMEE